jgi:hypothetical protein
VQTGLDYELAAGMLSPSAHYAARTAPMCRWCCFYDTNGTLVRLRLWHLAL